MAGRRPERQVEDAEHRVRPLLPEAGEVAVAIAALLDPLRLAPDGREHPLADPGGPRREHDLAARAQIRRQRRQRLRLVDGGARGGIEAEADRSGQGRRRGAGLAGQTDHAGHVQPVKQRRLRRLADHASVQAEASQRQAENPTIEDRIRGDDGDAVVGQGGAKRAPAGLDQPPEAAVAYADAVHREGKLLRLDLRRAADLLKNVQTSPGVTVTRRRSREQSQKVADSAPPFLVNPFVLGAAVRTLDRRLRPRWPAGRPRGVGRH